MAAFNTPPGFTVEDQPLSVGSDTVLVPHPDTGTSFPFVNPPGITVDDSYVSSVPPAPTSPTAGQIWPRGK